MICVICNRKIKQSASKAMLIGPVCWLKYRAKDPIFSVKVKRDDKTPDMFEQFIAQLEWMP